MKWFWVFLCVVSQTFGDAWSARGMSQAGEVEHFGPKGLLRVLRYVVTTPIVLLGVISNAVSFLSLLALLTVAPLSFAVPATAVSYVLKIGLAEWYLKERVGWLRWTGALLVAVGVYLLST